MRIENHPILNFQDKKQITFQFEGQPMAGREGDTIASALVDNGVKVFSYGIKKKRPRGFYCAIGNCASCNMVVNGQPNVRTCITPLENGMDIKIQRDKGVIE